MFRALIEVKRANKAIGHHWFERSNVEYSGSQVVTPILGGFYWVESVYRNAASTWDFNHSSVNSSPDDFDLGRAFKAVGASPDGAVQYLYGAESFPTKQAAVDYINGIIADR